MGNREDQEVQDDTHISGLGDQIDNGFRNKNSEY